MHESESSRIYAGVATVTLQDLPEQNFSQHQSIALWLHSLTATVAPASLVLFCGGLADGEGCWECSGAMRVRKYYRHLLWGEARRWICAAAGNVFYHIHLTSLLLKAFSCASKRFLWRSGLFKPIMRPCCQIEL